MILKYNQEVKDTLTQGYERLIIPKVVMGTPVALKNLELVDEEGESLGYATINNLSEIFGTYFVPIDIIDDRFTMVRWAFEKPERLLFETFCTANGLVIIEDYIEDVDFDNLVGNEVFIVPLKSVSKFPKVEAEEI